MIKIGKISSINDKKGTARVLFPDRQGVVSGDLSIVVPFTLSGKVYYMPEINERVICVYDNLGTGFIIGSFYADTRLPSDGNKNKVYMDFNDGTKIIYDKKEKIFDIICNGDINIIGKKINIIEKGA